MCVRSMRINSRHAGAPVFSFIPCGKCEECRDSKRVQWTFRNRCELESARKNGWHIGFFTLTYSDKYLPLIPRHMFLDAYKPLCCFSRTDVRRFIDNIRKRANERWKVSNLRYLIACEYGEHTRRSHMHGIICFPPTIKPRDMWNLIHESWTTDEWKSFRVPDRRCKNFKRFVCRKKRVREPLGHIFPRYFEGGVDSHGYEHKPFLVTGDIAKASFYAAKYCCKDIGYYAELSRHNLLDEPDVPFNRIRDYAPFHIQSQSFGKCYLDTLSDDRLLELIKDGESLVGSTHKQQLPVYIKNKIFYNLYYTFDDSDVYNDDGTRKPKDWYYDSADSRWHYCKGEGTHRRLVGRDATDFLRNNAKEIYRQKKEYFVDLFARMTTREFWIARGVKGNELAFVLNDVAAAHKQVDSLADYYLCHYGVPDSESEPWQPSHMQWLKRYVRSVHTSWSISNNPNDVLITKMCEHLRYITAVNKAHRDKVRYIHDLYKHLA